MNGQFSILYLTTISLSLGLFSGCCASSPPSSEKSEVKQEQYIGEVSVQGDVNRPCSVKIPKEGLTLGQAIQQAGGYRPRAQRRDIRISRMEAGKKVKLIVDSVEIDSGRSPDFPLRDGDTVVIGAGGC